jgi:hypothetical protein
MSPCPIVIKEVNFYLPAPIVVLDSYLTLMTKEVHDPDFVFHLLHVIFSLDVPNGDGLPNVR